jgi:hypothetical protein
MLHKPALFLHRYLLIRALLNKHGCENSFDIRLLGQEKCLYNYGLLSKQVGKPRLPIAGENDLSYSRFQYWKKRLIQSSKPAFIELCLGAAERQASPALY